MTGVQDYESQTQSAKQQAANYGEGTNILAGAVTDANQNLDEQVAMLKEAQEEGISPLWDVAMGKADEVVLNAQARTKTVMGDLDRLIDEIRIDRNFEKAHAMQVAVQTSLGQMNSYGDTIKRQYGVDSAEFAQFTQQKGMSLAMTQSNIHDSYAKIGAEIDQIAISATAQTSTQMAMFENYNEQAMLDVYRSAAMADQQYDLEISQQLIAIEQMKMNNQGMLAEWVANTTVFNASLSGILALI